ncbi:MAG: hypothetical protein ACE14W_05845 [Candidatus Velamenicoccus archaeovorus]
MQSPRLRRGLLGFSRRSVRLALAVRDNELAKASERLVTLESRVARLLAELERVEAEAQAERAELQGQIEALERRASEAEVTLARREMLADELRTELGSARRLFLRHAARARALEAELEDLAARLWETRADLATATAGDTLIVVPDLEGAGTNGRHSGARQGPPTPRI